MRKTISLLILVSSMIMSLFGAWLTNQEMHVYQSDGTEINCFASGDEFHNWLHDKNGYTIIQNQYSGDWVWAIKNGETLKASEYRVDKYNPVSLGISPNNNISNTDYLKKRDKFQATTRDIPSRAPSSGIINNLVVFIRFANESEFNQNINSYVTMLNDSSATGNSMKNYFREVSYQTLSVTSTFYPAPVNNFVVSYQDINPRSYFLPYSGSNPNGYTDEERVQREHQLLVRAVEAIADLVPDDLNLDGDEDGKVDNVCFVIKGSPGAWADLLWPHRWSLYSETAYINTKRVWDFNFQLQTSLNSDGASVLSHEMFHSLGAPDLYRYQYDGNPIGAWDLMASNTNPPQHMNSYMKYRYGYWIDNIPLINTSGDYSLKSVKSATNNCYRINSPFNNNEYFVLEYRNTDMGQFDSHLYGSGLLVYRVNTEADGQGNASGPPDEIYVYRPLGSPNSDGNIESAFFSSESGRTMINDASNPYCFLSDGSFGGLNISNIGSTADSITFHVQIIQSSSDDIDEDFENGAFTDYDWDNSSTNPWTVTNTGYQSTHSARPAVISDLQSSELNIMLNVEFGFLQFYVKTATQANADYLKFYIDNTEMGSWSGTNGWTHVNFPVSAGIHNFKWIYLKDASGSVGADAVYIDRIGFPEFAGPIYLPPRQLTCSMTNRDALLNWKKPLISVYYDLGPVLSYEIYKNNNLFASVNASDSTFIDLDLEGGNITYFVKAVYNNGTSTASNSVVASLPYLTPNNLSASIVNAQVVLNWQAPTNSSRSLAGYKVYKNGTSMFTGVITATNFTDPNVVLGTTYEYYIKAVYQNPTAISGPSNTISINVTANDEIPNPTLITKLQGNYPNPFNPNTSIAFSLDKKSKLNISIYNVKGELVKTIVNAYLNPGNYNLNWDGKNEQFKSVSAGIYFLRMSTEDYLSSKKMILLK